ncbi:MAG: type II secretion system protein [Bdellovibrionaceae bacterium]|nr:type II secretion system protein [Pseudobdellovibrionaceae bacterium]
MGIRNIIRQKAEKAFSLIEILVVLFIIGILFTISSKNIFNKSQSVRTVFDKLIRLNKRLTSISTLHGKTYRLVIKLDTKNTDQYWVEKKIITKSEEEEDNEEKFQIDDSFYSEPQSIPPLLDITKIETVNSSKKEGTVYIYYYPSALAQSSKIYFLRPDNQGVWTLYLDPVTKKLRVLKDEKDI